MPAGLIFDGKFAGKSTQQLSLLNSTVSQLAGAANEVLTKCYRAIYGDDDEGDSPPVLALHTAPLSASEEVVALYQAQLLPCSHAIKASMHALGVTPSEIEKAVEELCMKEKKAEQQNDEALKQQKEDAKISAEERKAGIEATKAQTEVTKKEAAGMIKKHAASSSSSK